MAQEYLKNTAWNDYPINKANEGIYRCVVCSLDVGGGTSKIVRHELECINTMGKQAVVKLVARCTRKPGCKEVRVVCRFGLPHNCLKSPTKEGRILKILTNITSIDELIQTCDKKAA